jgi:hypothetical protein
MEMPYNFISIPDKVFNLWKRGRDYTVDKISLFNFILFCLLMLAVPICVVIVTPIILLAGVEHLLYTIMDYLDEVGDENKFKSYMSYTGIIIMLVPTLIFFGPGLIYHSIKKHREKKESALNREMEMTIERIRCNNREMERLQRYTRRNRVEDFKPKKYLVPHNFRKGKVIIPGVYIEGNMSTTSGYNSIAIGHNNTVAGYYNNNGQPNRIRYE